MGAVARTTSSVSFAMEFLAQTAQMFGSWRTEGSGRKPSMIIEDGILSSEPSILLDVSVHTSIVETILEHAMRHGQTDESKSSDDEEREDEPSLTKSNSSGSHYSLEDDLSAWRVGEATAVYYRPDVVSRRVTFHPEIEVREYSLTVSHHPCCEDPYPVSLDWAYSKPYLRYIDDSKTRRAAYNPGRRLGGPTDKRRRLAYVRGCSEMDIDEMIHQIHHIHQSPSALLVPTLGRLITSCFSRLRFAPTMILSTTRQRDYLADEDHDEYILLYSGTGMEETESRPGTMEDPEWGFY